MNNLKKNLYDLLLCDIPTYFSNFFNQELNINKQTYIDPTCIYNRIDNVFDYKASYHPLGYTTFTELMSYKERFMNHFYLLSTRFLNIYNGIFEQQIFKKLGYKYELERSPAEAFYINQCVDGFHYSISLPPNIVTSGAILPEVSKSIENKELENFLLSFEKNIFVSQGTLFENSFKIQSLFEVIESYPNLGFVLALKANIFNGLKLIPKNVFIDSWLPQMTYLGTTR